MTQSSTQRVGSTGPPLAHQMAALRSVRDKAAPAASEPGNTAVAGWSAGVFSVGAVRDVGHPAWTG